MLGLPRPGRASPTTRARQQRAKTTLPTEARPDHPDPKRPAAIMAASTMTGPYLTPTALSKQPNPPIYGWRDDRLATASKDAHRPADAGQPHRRISITATLSLTHTPHPKERHDDESSSLLTRSSTCPTSSQRSAGSRNSDGPWGSSGATIRRIRTRRPGLRVTCGDHEIFLCLGGQDGRGKV